MSRALTRILPQFFRNELGESPIRRAVTPFVGSNWGGPDYIDREFRRMENIMNRIQRDLWNTFDSFPSGSLTRNLAPMDATGSLFKIVEEDGKQKVRVQFDAENCKPENIEVKSKGKLLEIRARHEEKGDYHSSYQEYSRTVTLPEGVKPEELTCKFEDGVVTLEAPYSPPVEETKQIPIKQEKVEPTRKEIPIKHEQHEAQA